MSRRLSVYRIRKRDRHTGKVLDSRLYARGEAALNRARAWATEDRYTVTVETSTVLVPITDPISVEVRGSELVALPRYELEPLTKRVRHE